MKQTKLLMGMHITIEVVDTQVKQQDIDAVYDYFTYIDQTFSTYKANSEISRINSGKLHKNQYTKDMETILALCEQTNRETDGYFNIEHNGKLDPSGIVKGWAIWQAAQLLKQKGFKNFYIDAGGDVQVYGKNVQEKPWIIGIKNPFSGNQIVKVIALEDKGIATSGTYTRGQHIYDPKHPEKKLTDIISLTVIGPNVYEADRFATAAFAMQKDGIYFIEQLSGFEGYMIDNKGVATYTKHFEDYVLPSNQRSHVFQ